MNGLTAFTAEDAEHAEDCVNGAENFMTTSVCARDGGIPRVFLKTLNRLSRQAESLCALSVFLCAPCGSGCCSEAASGRSFAGAQDDNDQV